MSHKHAHTSQKQCFKDAFNGCVSKPSPPKKLRLSNQTQQQDRPSSLPPTTVPLQLPDFFDSDEEESDFYGFSAEAVLSGVASSNKFTYYLPQKWKHLFDSGQEDDDFDGFTKEELYVVYVWSSTTRDIHPMPSFTGVFVVQNSIATYVQKYDAANVIIPPKRWLFTLSS